MVLDTMVLLLETLLKLNKISLNFSYTSNTYIHLNPIFVHSYGFPDGRRMREIKKERLPVYFMHKVDIFTATVKDFTD
jgi:hypothetical protein